MVNIRRVAARRVCRVHLNGRPLLQLGRVSSLLMAVRDGGAPHSADTEGGASLSRKPGTVVSFDFLYLSLQIAEGDPPFLSRR